VPNSIVLFDGFCTLFVWFLVLSDAFISRVNNSGIAFMGKVAEGQKNENRHEA